ncbi:hypothetical protein ACEWY4_017633 [Coilia grayii]|uniref:Lysozyme n=1 Tax=Coilia grayii TaxID=363190 RepID=A0ABD1JIJ6_9TELE
MRVMLAKLAVLAIVASISDGLVLSKCDVRDHFKAMLKNLPIELDHTELMTVKELIAIATCHFELASGFNTSAVKQLTVPSDVTGGPGLNSAHHGGSSPSEEEDGSSMDSNSSEDMSGLGSGHSTPTRRPVPPKDAWTLNGIFQLPDRVTCDSGLVPSLNICQTDCSNFLDNDVDDDIACIKEILAKMFSLVFQKECLAINYNDYFAGCP